jgi:cytochrome d ubiquinol oxidase subunit II
VPADASSASLAAWTSPTSLLAGFLFVAACGYLAAVYLVGEARRRGNRAMQTYFARRAQAAAVVAGALSLAALFELQNSNRLLFDRLTGRALPLVVVAGVCGLVVFALLAIGRPIGIRVIAALGVAAVVWGWGVAQFPVLLPGTSVTLSTAGAPQQTVIAVIVVFIAAVILVGPAFGLLFALQGRRLLGDGGHGALAAAGTAGHPVPPAAGGRPRREPAEQEQAGPGARTAALGIVTIAAVIRRMRQR